MLVTRVNDSKQEWKWIPQEESSMMHCVMAKDRLEKYELQPI